jgi:ankyrin repeat protein
MDHNLFVKELSTAERTDEYFRSLGLPLHDITGMMGHILDSLGALKYRLENEEISYPSHLVQTFGHSVKLLVDHIIQFEPIDSESGVKFLVDDAFPDDSKRKDNRQWLPLHWACAIHSTTPDVMAKIVEERPLTLTQGHLHYERVHDEYLENMNDDSYLQALTKPRTENDKGYKGLLPFHFLISLKYPNPENVKLLINKNPDLISLPDHRGWLPIHFCAYNNRNSEVMNLLIQLYPQGCYEVNKKGKLPFQLACYNRYVMMMDLLYQENPEAIQGMDYNGNTPLHDACKTFNYEIIQRLLSIQPELNTVRNFKEQLPIHRLFSFIPKESFRLQKRQFESLKCLCSVNPEVISLPDRNNQLPLHLAVIAQAGYEVIEYIYNIYPSGALIKDSQGKLAIHYVNSAAVKKLLMKASPPLVKAGITDTFSRFLG